MRASTLRAAVGRLAFLMTSVALGACADQLPSSPAVQPNVVSGAAGNVVSLADIASGIKISVTRK